MKAIIHPSWTKPTIFSYTTTHPPPSFQPSKCHKKSVLIEVHSAAINPVDYKLPKMAFGPVVGMDFCGRILEVGSDVTELQVGQNVYGIGHGTLAAQTIARARDVAVQPDHWTAVNCAALGVAYQSAFQALRRGEITPTLAVQRHVLIIGASGGCGIAGVQLCKAMGVTRIVGVCSSKNEMLVKEAGATEIVDYTDSKALEVFFQENKGTFDCVFDAATGSGKGEEYWTKSIPLLKTQNPTGIYVALNGSRWQWMRKMFGVPQKNQSILLVNGNRQDLENIVELMDRVEMKPVTNVMAFTEEGMEEAFGGLMGRRTRGKIVFQVKEEEK